MWKRHPFLYTFNNRNFRGPSELIGGRVCSYSWCPELFEKQFELFAKQIELIVELFWSTLELFGELFRIVKRMRKPQPELGPM